MHFLPDDQDREPAAALLTEQAAAICPGDCEARSVVTVLLSEREKIEECDAGVREIVAAAIKDAKRDESFLRGCKKIRDEARDQQRRLSDLNVRLALRGWIPGTAYRN